MPVQKNSLPRLKTVDLTAADAKRTYNRDLFREVALAYDRVTGILSFGQDRSWKQKLLNGLPEELTTGICVDLACGTGDITLQLAKKYPAARVLGIDLSKDMIALAAVRGPADAHVAYIQGDMGRIPLPDNSVDIVTGGYALRNAPDLDLALKEAARVLCPGGIAAFLDFSKPAGKIAAEGTIRTLGLWGSLWGLVFHQNAEVYRYIADSLRHYPDRTALTEKCLFHGLETESTTYFFQGFMELRFLKKGR